MKVAIVGSRDYTNMEQVRAYVRTLPEQTTAISGGARGVDTVAVDEALKRWDLDTLVFPAEWKLYGKSAGYRRNADIVAASDRIVAFHDGQSSGTAHTIKLARQAGKPVEVHYADGRVEVQP